MGEIKMYKTIFAVVIAVAIVILSGNKTLAASDQAIRAQEKAWEIIDNYAEPEYFLSDPMYNIDPSLMLAYGMTEEEFLIIKEDAERVISGCDTQYEKISSIHDYVGHLIIYEESIANLVRNSYDTWYLKRGQCENIANLVRSMLIAVDIPCMKLSGDNHAYNAAYDSDNDRWIFLDATIYCIDISMEYRAEADTFDVLKLEGILYENVYYELYTGDNQETEWESMQWNFIVIGAKDKSVRQISIPEDICGIPVTDTDVGIFSGCTNLEKVNIPDTITELEALAFCGSGIKDIDLSDTKITSIGQRCFSGCTNLTRVILPDGLLELGYGSFERCEKLKKIDLSNTKLSFMENSMFDQCTLLEEIIFPAELKEMDDGVFSFGLNSLKEIDLTNTKVESIGDSAFPGCYNLTEIKFPSTLKELGERAFWGNGHLKTIDLSNTKISVIEDRMFDGCYSIESIAFPATLVEIGEGICWNCDCLRELDLINTMVKQIGDFAFTDCGNIEVIKLPNTIESIGKSAFSIDGEYKLTYIISELTEEEIINKGYIYDGSGKSYPSFWKREIYVGMKLCNVKYVLNGGIQNSDNPDKYVDTMGDILLMEPEREGYTFDGWYTDSRFRNEIKYLSSVSSDNATLYAKWIVESESITDEKDDTTAYSEENTTTKKSQDTTEKIIDNETSGSTQTMYDEETTTRLQGTTIKETGKDIAGEEITTVNDNKTTDIEQNVMSGENSTTSDVVQDEEVSNKEDSMLNNDITNKSHNSKEDEQSDNVEHKDNRLFIAIVVTVSLFGGSALIALCYRIWAKRRNKISNR